MQQKVMKMAKPIKLNDILNSPLNKDKSAISSKDFNTMFSGGSVGEIVGPGNPLPDVIEIPDLPRPSGLKFHIEINTSDSKGNSMHIHADADNKDDIDVIHERYKEFMPRKKILGLF